MNPYIAKYVFYYPVTYFNGENISKYLKEYNDFQWVSAEEVCAIQRINLSRMLRYAKNNSAYYARRLNGVDSVDDFSAVPFLTKQLLISDFHDICVPNIKGVSLKTTGGSTGEPVKLFKNSDALARERAATWRSYSWAGIGIGDKQARFWGVPHAEREAKKAQLIDFISNRMRLSAFDLTSKTLEHYYRKLLRFKPKYLYGYVSVIRRFCEYIQERQLGPIPSLQAVITTSEILTQADKLFIENICNVRVFNEYGCGEVGSIAHQCEYGNMHIMADNLLVEIVDAHGNPAVTGEVVVTDFFNYATPLIRYKLGDFASISNEVCGCGRGLPILQGIYGRAYDIVKTQAGKSIHPEALIYVFEALQQKYQAFSQFQIIQKKINQLEINIIPTSAWGEHLKGVIEKEIYASVDPSFHLLFNLKDEILRENSGKMRVVKSDLA
ncbi:MAG: capsular polysaccharide biosynthesis protein CapK [Pseudomonadota bacterium]|jgi:phenylacetate-CoA ligase